MNFLSVLRVTRSCCASRCRPSPVWPSGTSTVRYVCVFLSVGVSPVICFFLASAFGSGDVSFCCFFWGGGSQEWLLSSLVLGCICCLSLCVFVIFGRGCFFPSGTSPVRCVDVCVCVFLVVWKLVFVCVAIP